MIRTNKTLFEVMFWLDFRFIIIWIQHCTTYDDDEDGDVVVLHGRAIVHHRHYYTAIVWSTSVMYRWLSLLNCTQFKRIFRHAAVFYFFILRVLWQWQREFVLELRIVISRLYLSVLHIPFIWGCCVQCFCECCNVIRVGERALLFYFHLKLLLLLLWRCSRDAMMMLLGCCGLHIPYIRRFLHIGRVVYADEVYERFLLHCKMLVQCALRMLLYLQK